MKRFMVVLFVLCAAVLSAQTYGDRVYNSMPTVGPADIATNVFTVPLTAPVRCPTLPEGKTQFQVSAWGQDIIAASSGDVSSAAVRVGIIIKAGASRVFDTATTTPSWYFLASGSANATGVIDAAW